MNLRDTIEALIARGFTVRSDPYLGSGEENEAVISSREGRCVLLVMPCIVSFPDAERYGDLEVWVSSWDRLEVLEQEGAGPIFCGGLYTFMRIFAHGQAQGHYNGLGEIPDDPGELLEA